MSTKSGEGSLTSDTTTNPGDRDGGGYPMETPGLEGWADLIRDEENEPDLPDATDGGKPVFEMFRTSLDDGDTSGSGDSPEESTDRNIARRRTHAVPTPSAQQSMPGESAWTLRVISSVETLSHLLDPGEKLSLEVALRKTGGHAGLPNPLKVTTTVPNQARKSGLMAKVMEPGFGLTSGDHGEFRGTIQLENSGKKPLSLEGVVIHLFSEEVQPPLMIEHEPFPKKKPAQSPSSARALNGWTLVGAGALFAFVAPISWFFQITWGTTIGAILAALAAIWGVNAPRQRVNLTGNHVAGLTAVAVFILICVGGITLLTAPSETTEEEAGATTSDTTKDETEEADTPVADNVSAPPSTDPAKPAEPAPATVTGEAAAPPAPITPAAPPAPKPPTPVAEKPPEPKGPAATLPNTDTCEAILRPNTFSQSEGKFGAVCGKESQKGVYRVDSSEKVGGMYAHKNLVLLSGVKPPQ